MLGVLVGMVFYFSVHAFFMYSISVFWMNLLIFGLGELIFLMMICTALHPPEVQV